MTNITIYHNPRCSKSREALALLNEQGTTPNVVEYLKDPPDAAALKAIVEKLDVEASSLVREKEFKELGVPTPDSDDQWIRLIAEHPRIMQRPIVVSGANAVIGRPPENVLAIL